MDHDQIKCPFCAAPHSEVWIEAPDRFNGRREQYRLLRCAACALVWLHDPPSETELGNHYGPDYDRTIANAAKGSNHWFGRRDELRRLKPDGGAILDLGCASGGFLSTLEGLPWKLFGVEMSEDAARVARDRCGAEVFVGNILDVPFPPQSFDAITCFNVFEHVYEPKEVLSRVSNWLKPGGIFFTVMPNIDSAGARIFGSYWYALELPRHLYHFSPMTLNMLAKSVGLEEVLIKARRDLYLERSVGYVKDEALRKLGFTRCPAEQSGEPRLAWKVLRKGFRLTLLPVITAAASLAGDGEMIYAVFAKNSASDRVTATSRK